MDGYIGRCCPYTNTLCFFVSIPLVVDLPSLAAEAHTPRRVSPVPEVATATPAPTAGPPACLRAQ